MPIRGEANGMSPSRLADTLVVVGLVVVVGAARCGPTILRAATDVWETVHTVIAERTVATFEEFGPPPEGLASLPDEGARPADGSAGAAFDGAAFEGTDPALPPRRDPRSFRAEPPAERGRTRRDVPLERTRSPGSPPPGIVFVPPVPFPAPPECLPGAPPWEPCEAWGRPVCPFEGP
jgi:hypothetical protein